LGERGEGKFVPISWDEALDTIADELLRVKRAYGPSAIFCQGSSASPGRLQNPAPVFRLINMFGGCIYRWSSVSGEGAYFASRATYGVVTAGHTREDILSSRLVLMWGWNPAETIWGTDTTFHLIQAKEKGVKFIAIDPRFTNSAALLADQWVPIRPGTDTALLLAMAYVIIKENLEDGKFLNTYTTGFEVFADYVLGKEDGVPKSPSWAEPITGVPHTVTEKLALEYATGKPAALMPGFSPGRTAFGEQFHRAAATLATMTGNIGISGGSPGCCDIPNVLVSPGPNIPSPSLIPIGANPVEADAPPASLLSLNPPLRSRSRVNSSQLWDAMLYGKAGGYPSDIKLLYIACSNPVNQYPNVNKAVKALRKPEFIVVHEQFLTATAKFADIVLPVTTHWERNDLLRPWGAGTYLLFANKAIAPLYQCKSDFEICVELAPRLGITNYSDKSEEEWLKEIIASSPDTSKEITNYSSFKKEGIHRVKLSEPLVAFKEQIQDPAHNPFPTPSGKIEIFSQRLADLQNPLIPPIPKFIPTWEGKDDPLTREYPLQLVTFHFKTRAHSCFYNVSWLRELDPHTVWINPLDAQERDIRSGDKVRVFNQRGETVITAYVTHRIMLGVVALGEGAWYEPDERGVDHGGCANVLTRDEPSPAGALASNTVLVQIKKP
jgi:anaerobic dimethyl sulfoxide reductase subunit A